MPSLSIKEILDQVYGLLMAPEPDDPLDRYKDICMIIKYLCHSLVY